MTVYNEIINMREMGLIIQSIRGLLKQSTKKKQQHNILYITVHTAQETLEDVPKDKSTNVKANSRTTIQDEDIMDTSLTKLMK